MDLRSNSCRMASRTAVAFDSRAQANVVGPAPEIEQPEHLPPSLRAHVWNPGMSAGAAAR